jgi:hypothetical protein
MNPIIKTAQNISTSSQPAPTTSTSPLNKMFIEKAILESKIKLFSIDDEILKAAYSQNKYYVVCTFERSYATKLEHAQRSMHFKKKEFKINAENVVLYEDSCEYHVYQYLTLNGYNPEVCYQHDGCGIRDWFEIVIKW